MLSDSVTDKMADAAGARLLKAGGRLVHMLYDLQRDATTHKEITEAEETIYCTRPRALRRCRGQWHP